MMQRARGLWGVILLGSAYLVHAGHVIEDYVTNRTGERLYSLYAPSEDGNPNAPTIFWLHGFSRHARCMAEAMLYFAERGYNNIAYDLRGHGRSDGQMGHIDLFEDHCKDVCDVYAYYRSLIKGDLFVVAHSMGGIVALRTLQCYPEQFPAKVVVLGSPGLLPHPRVVSPLKLRLARMLAIVVPRLPFKLMSRDSLCTTHDSAIIARNAGDPYLITHVTPSSVVKAFDACAAVMAGADQFLAPIHIVMSGKDKMVDGAKTLQFFDRLSEQLSTSCTVYPHLYHSLFNELGRDRVYQKINKLLEVYLIKNNE